MGVSAINHGSPGGLLIVGAALLEGGFAVSLKEVSVRFSVGLRDRIQGAGGLGGRIQWSKGRGEALRFSNRWSRPETSDRRVDARLGGFRIM